jgi:hypothetical protein
MREMMIDAFNIMCLDETVHRSGKDRQSRHYMYVWQWPDAMPYGVEEGCLPMQG